MDLDRLSEYASKIDLRRYKGVYRNGYVSSQDFSEQGAYFCAVSKSLISFVTEVFPLMLIHSLYEFQEWPKEEEPFADFSQSEWKSLLRTHWIPEYLGLKDGAKTVAHRFVSETKFKEDWLPISNQIATAALTSPILTIVRYSEIDAWNFSNYIIETATEYVDFQYWTTA